MTSSLAHARLGTKSASTGSSRRRGFTLLEVMVAVAILGVALTAIFSSQVGAMRAANRARHTEIATILARCKMAEVEEHVLREGLPAIEAGDRDECCEGAEVEGYKCRWALERITLPELAQGMPGAAGAAQPGGAPNAPGSAGMLAGAASVGDFLTGGAGGGFSGMAMNLAFPVLKPQIEEQVRRATVTVEWKEGERTQSFDVVYFMVNPQGTIQQQAAQQAVSAPPSSPTLGGTR